MARGTLPQEPPEQTTSQQATPQQTILQQQGPSTAPTLETGPSTAPTVETTTYNHIKMKVSAITSLLLLSVSDDHLLNVRYS